ncbi:SH3 domain-containing protein [Kribbella shirazensis]|uniref:SH3b domain-containing protein n=1 Tax=Kribbella shirazensis TaxID=1105143 RepID=A0A7X5VGN0_9ACTN|nr:hypothetical protein [Kribbella shirazensis]NIK60868.1 hypothetical protein [Kribbella shirazensis]
MRILRVVGLIVAGLVSLGALLTVLFLALAAYGYGFAGVPDVTGAQVSYVRKEAIVRTCPSTACAQTETLHENQQVTVVREVQGEFTRDSSTWVEIKYGPETRFVHSSLLTSTSNDEQYRFWGGVSLATVGVMLVVAVVARTSMMKQWVDRRIGSVEVLLPLVVLGGGIAVGAVGFLYSRIGGTTVPDFVGDALVNIGAGLIGSAATFILFQSLFSGRVVERPRFDEREAQLAQRLDRLEALMVVGASSPESVDDRHLTMLSKLAQDVGRLRHDVRLVQQRPNGTGRRRGPLRSRRNRATGE